MKDSKLLGRAPLISLTAFILFACASLLSSKTIASTINIDTQQHHQRMQGWEVTARMWEFDKKNNRYNPSWTQFTSPVFDHIVSESGVNRIRLEVMSGAENPVDYWSKFERGEISYTEFKRHFYEKINDNDLPQVTNLKGFQFSALDNRIENVVLPIKQRLLKRGEKLHINFCYVDFKWTQLQGSLSHAKAVDEYSEFIIVYFQHMRDKYGFVPDTLEIILEPDNTHDWRGQEIGEALIAVARRLEKEGFHPRFIAPSTAELHNASDYMRELLAVDGASDYLDVLSYHRYGFANLQRNIRQQYLRGIASISQQYQISTAMLEHVEADVDELLEDLTITNANAWQQYAIATAYADNGAYLLLVDENSDPRQPDIRPAKRTPLLEPYFRNIRMGAVRVEASSNDKSKQPVAFYNVDGSFVLLIKNDDSSNTSLSINGLPPGHYTISFTSADAISTDTESSKTILLDAEVATAQSPNNSRANNPVTPLEINMPGQGVMVLHSMQSQSLLRRQSSLTR